jgi:serine/threonine protein kinase/tetratricopeptide (TPR) repeat protein
VALAPRMALLPPSLGRYEVLEELGKGAMGVVYLARDPLIGRLVALKTFRAAQAMHGSELVEYRARFMREAQSAGILSHPNIVTIHDVVDSAEGGFTFIAMEYVRGTNLKELLLRGQALSLDQVVHIASQIADGLDYAHAKGVIHRDIKPANIIIDPQGMVKITDFGIARLETSDLTHEGQLLGTPNYMAPERIIGHKVDLRTDIFSLGVVIYEMLTRQKPFQGENLTMVSHRIVYEAFTPPRQYAPGLPEGVVRVLDRALEKEPEARYASAGELSRELREAVATATGNETRVGQRPSLVPPGIPGGPPPLPPSASGTPSSGVHVVSPPPPPPGSAADESGAATQDVAHVAAAVVAAGPPPQRKLPGSGRIAVVSAVAAGVALLLTAAAFGWLNWRQPTPPAADPQSVQKAQYLPLLQQARQELDAGRPEQALAAITRAVAIAPQDPDLLRMQGQVRSAILERQTAAEQQAQREELLAAGEAALVGGQPNQAADLARQVLALQPAEARATTLLASAEAAIERKRQRDAAAAARRSSQPAAAAPPTAAQPVTPATADPAVEQRPATLRVDFFTEQPEGVLSIYAGGQRIVSEPFEFYKRSGLRREPKAGRIEASRELAAGRQTLRIYVAPPGRQPIVRTIDVQLRGGGSHLLRIHLDAAGNLAAALE